MKRIIIGSFLGGIITAFGILGLLDNDIPLLASIVYFVFWYSVWGIVIYKGIKAVLSEKVSSN